MKNNVKDYIQVIVVGLFVFCLSLWAWIAPGPNYSDRERRPLAEFPELNFESLKKGDKEGGFMSGFQTYSVERFPMRDTFMSIKSLSDHFFYKKLDSNGYYIVDGNVGQIVHPTDEKSFEWALSRFQILYDSSILGKTDKVYLSIIPDKNAFVVDEYGYIGIDYEKCYEYFQGNMPYAKYVDITDLLSLEDYYKTDTHWRQEKITDVADRLAEAMGVELVKDYTTNKLDILYGGTFYDKSPIPVKKDEFYYLTNDVINNCILTYYDEMGNPVKSTVYDLQKAYDKDPYELFLGGFNQSLVIVDNPNAMTDKELVVFRDSFGSSIIPLLASGYKSITVIDIRYKTSKEIGLYTKKGIIDSFENKDVLFLYSTLVLNQSNQLQ